MSALHEDATAVLTAWRAPDAEQDKLRDEYLDHLAAHPDGALRACTDGHLTGSMLILDAARERVLLTLHAKLRLWLQTGGHSEPSDTSLAGVALREGAEESGIEGLRLLVPEPVRLDRHLAPCAWHLDVQYAAVAPAGAVESISEESLALRWFGFEEAREVSDDSVRALLDRTRTLL